MIDFQIFQIGNQVIHAHKQYPHDYALETEDNSERILDSSRFLITDNWKKFEAREVEIDLFLLSSNGQDPLEVWTSLKSLEGTPVPIIAYTIKDCHNAGNKCNCCFCNDTECKIFWLESYGKLISISNPREKGDGLITCNIKLLIFNPFKTLNPMMWEFLSISGGYRNPRLLHLTYSECDIPYHHPTCQAVTNMCAGFLKYTPYNPLYLYNPEWYTKDWCLPVSAKFAIDWQPSSNGYSIRVDREVWNGASSFYVFRDLLDHDTDITISWQTEKIYDLNYFTAIFNYADFLVIVNNLGLTLTNDMIIVIGDVKEGAFLTDYENRYPIGSCVTRTGGEFVGQIHSGMNHVSVRSEFDWSMLHLFHTW